MAKNKKESTTSVGNIPPLTDYVDGITSYYLAPHLRRSYPVRRDGDVVSTALEEDAFIVGEETEKELESGSLENKESIEEIKSTRKSPTLMDIELVSNEIVYDASGIPTSKVTFKVRNSSGEAVKAVNVLVEKK
jgi:hypothetical protein